MKIKILILLLLFFSNLNAQTNFDTAKLKNNSIDVENRFILPVYKNQIVDAEKFFSENEIQLLHKSIDSIFRSIKLKIQVAFVTPEYYDNNTSKFDLFTDSLSNKWHTDQEEARVILIVSMSDRTAKMIMSGRKLNSNFKDLIKIMKEKREPTKIEKENIENLSQLTNKILFEEAMLGVNLKAKNYVKALNNYFNPLLKNSHLIFDMN
ncbi:MAG TPA: hypothetical protein DEB23_06270 [Chitinophagaceae bacterium]|nr:hypothetical protein [Chitinophagaceae bacterium]